MRKKTHEEFLRELINISPTIRVKGLYSKGKEPIECECLVCGYEWSPIARGLLKGHGCPSCAGNIKLTHEQFLTKFKDRNPSFDKINVIGRYDGMTKKIKCDCKICGTPWNPRAYDLIRGSGCPSCSGNIGFTHDRFINDIKEKNPHYDDILILSKYSGSYNRIECCCKICNYKWYPMATSLLQGTGCPNCAKKNTIERCREQFKKNNYKTIMSQDDFELRFRERNPYSSTIRVGEYKGSDEPIQCECIKCGHKWFTRPTSLLHGSNCPKCSHTSTSFMEQFLFFSLQKVLGKKNVINRDKNLIGEEIDIYIPSKSFAIEIGSWKWHKETIDKDLKKINACNSKNVKLIEIFDEYKGSIIENQNVWTFTINLAQEPEHKTLRKIVLMLFETMQIQDQLTSNDWNEIKKDAYLNSQRMSHEDFVNKLRIKNKHFDNIELLSTYTTSINKIKCRCKICNYEWETAASNLSSGSGCPKCGNSHSKKDVIIEWRKNHPDSNKSECVRQTGISRMTVIKWWNNYDASEIMAS